MTETHDLLRKLQPILGKRTKALWQWYLISKSSGSPTANLDFLRLLADVKAKSDYQEAVRLPPPEPDVLCGEYELGQVIYPDKPYCSFGLREREFIKHILIAGMTGTGKTNLAFMILRELGKKGKPFLVFDWKRNYRELKRFPELRDLQVIRLGDPDCQFRFNPLIPPPGVDPRHWLGLLVDVIKHAFFVAYGPEYFFRKAIDQLYGSFGVYKGSSVYPTFQDVEQLLKKEFVRGREMLWMSSAKRTLAVLTFSGMLGRIVNVRNQGDLGRLFKQNVILEMDNLATLEKVFLVEALLLWLYYFRKSQGRLEKFNHAVVLEEAHHVLSGRKEAMSGEESVIEMVIRMIREFGESVVVIDQEPSKLSKSIVANTNTKVCFSLGNGDDIRAMSRAMSLREEEARSVERLQVGQAVVKVKDRVVDPVCVKFKLVKGREFDGEESDLESGGTRIGTP